MKKPMLTTVAATALALGGGIGVTHHTETSTPQAIEQWCGELCGGGTHDDLEGTGGCESYTQDKYLCKDY